MIVKISFHDFYFDLFVDNFLHYTEWDSGVSLEFDILLRLMSNCYDINLTQILMRIHKINFCMRLYNHSHQ